MAKGKTSITFLRSSLDECLGVLVPEHPVVDGSSEDSSSTLIVLFPLHSRGLTCSESICTYLCSKIRKQTCTHCLPACLCPFPVDTVPHELLEMLRHLQNPKMGFRGYKGIDINY